MTLEEAIIHAEEVVDRCEVTDGDRACTEAHRQLAEWLRELQETRKERDYWQEKAHSYEQTIFKLTDAISKQPKRTFVELLVHYPHPDVCTYPEYKGKPYYSIKYIEDGECFVGFGTYKPEVLSQYLRDYFMPSAQPHLITMIQTGIKATDADDPYSCGMRNGMRWCMSLIDGKDPLYENCPSSQLEERTEKRTETHACDLISRQAAVELAMKYCPDDDGAVQCDGDIRGLLDELENLPPAQPEPERTMEEFMYGQDMGNPEDGSL